jgi:hypothetical protein
MVKGFINPAADFLPNVNKVTKVQEAALIKETKVEKANNEDVKPVKTADVNKGKITKITIEIDYEDSLKINRIVDAYKLMDQDNKYSKKWFLTKSVKEAIEKTMADLNITL